MGSFSHIHLGIARAECGRPNCAVFHTDVHIESGRVDGQVIKAVTRDTESDGGEPPCHTATSLGNKGVHSAIGQIVDPGLGKIKSIESNFPLYVIKCIR